MPLYIKTTLWNANDEALVEQLTVRDSVSLNLGHRERFNLNITPTDNGDEVVGKLDWFRVHGDQVWLDYLLIGG